MHMSFTKTYLSPPSEASWSPVSLTMDSESDSTAASLLCGWLDRSSPPEPPDPPDPPDLLLMCCRRDLLPTVDNKASPSLAAHRSGTGDDMGLTGRSFLIYLSWTMSPNTLFFLLYGLKPISP
ncbi:unnamed protein product [Arabis nemorensis]|uniref:Uncharacterized protein n=1 Tax=Arabis nemorensis TaxID=586526 RepID=A0A565BIE0_9BRAS|nr:unnamed protein product [Arabis nemorensis]